MKIQHIFCCD